MRGEGDQGSTQRGRREEEEETRGKGREGNEKGKGVRGGRRETIGKEVVRNESKMLR